MIVLNIRSSAGVSCARVYRDWLNSSLLEYPLGYLRGSVIYGTGSHTGMIANSGFLGCVRACVCVREVLVVVPAEYGSLMVDYGSCRWRMEVNLLKPRVARAKSFESPVLVVVNVRIM